MKITPEIVAEAQRMLRERKTWREVTRALGFSAAALRYHLDGEAKRSLANRARAGRARTDDLRPQRERMQRPCLGCGKAFHSEGPGNRLCEGCNAAIKYGGSALA